ncbi:carboxymuconolactone decarboxylase family protein [Streptomyces sp. 4N509B]|uniref:carboxymuconolactone decarboxylase family protein n=1 Tax=Streptomyces sp. 4N509B TaxID=3457413 RepID=UPI003FD27FD8
MSATRRIDMQHHAPEVHQAMVRVHRLAKKGVEPVVAELVLIRASQINRCAFCLDMHVRAAQEAGESPERLHLLAAWDEVEGVYDEREQAALALTEAATLLTDGFVPDEVFARAEKHFSSEELAHLVALIATINAWNRINVAARTPPGPSAP